MFHHPSINKRIALFLAVTILLEVFAPATAVALTSGPAQPEFSSFEPVATTDMVDPFSGSFTYNLPVMSIPGPSGSGYAVSLSYHSGAGLEEEASWVGFGWTLNPGAINRTKVGNPDDVKNGTIVYENNMPEVYSVSASNRFGLEGFSFDATRTTTIASASFSRTKTFNNYKGFSNIISTSASGMNGLASLSYSVADGDASFSVDVNPGYLFKTKKDKIRQAIANANEKHKNTSRVTTQTAYYRKKTQKDMSVKVRGILRHATADYGLSLITDYGMPTSLEEYDSNHLNIAVNFGGAPSPLPIGIEYGFTGGYVQQKRKNNEKYIYGTLHSQSYSSNSDNQLQDYIVEKESNYNGRDLNLSIPYTASDVFSVNGEGIGGGFSYVNNVVGHFYKANVENITDLYQAQVESVVGLNIKPVGIQVGVGRHTNLIKNWDNSGNTSTYSFSNFNSIPSDKYKENGYFRFSGDIAGNSTYSVDFNDSPDVAKLRFNETGYSVHLENPLFGTRINTNSEERAIRSSFIGSNTVEDFKFTQSNEEMRKVYTRDGQTRNYIQSVDPSQTKDQIAEYYTVNESGTTYVYGLPVYARNDKTTAYKMTWKNTYNRLDKKELFDNTNNDLSLFSSETNQYSSETHAYNYATTHLLTQILSSDYIDRTFDGPTPDDFGGWTKFNYEAGSNWYKWKFPYKGHDFIRGSLATDFDDMFQKSEGERQQYHLSSIETKTHIAFFVTNKTSITLDRDGQSITIAGSNIERKDAYEADGPVTGVNKSRMLEKIILYAKGSTPGSITGQPLKVVNLEYYDYQLPGQPQPPIPLKALAQNVGNASTGNGKLTLKRVWFEYEGIVNAKISPYEFSYEYKKDWTGLPANLSTKYGSILNYGSSFTSSDQNPSYSPLNIDAWGNYNPMKDVAWFANPLDANTSSLNRKFRLNNAVPQVNPTNFDPAAYQLKRITLPSGGEILVQYEQGDYKLVHNQPATTLVNLIDPNNIFSYNATGQLSGQVTKNETDNDKYYLDLRQLGVSTPSEVQALATEITSYLAQNKIYFKFLYDMAGGTNPDVGACNSEFIDGYTNAVATYEAATNKIYIQLVKGANQNERYYLPKQLCKDYYKKNLFGLKLNSDCSVDRVPIQKADAGDETSVINAVTYLISTNIRYNNSVCGTMSLKDSYFKIPVLYGKKGGPCRVKRVLMYDKGLLSGEDQMIYGSEYIYKLKDNKTSSGVATNEPAAQREESSLVNFLNKRRPQSLASKVIGGLDKENFEGPLGEYLLPGASIGYSRVVVQNIHSGKTNTGFVVNDYHTIAEHPIDRWMDDTPINTGYPVRVSIPAVLVTIKVDKRYATQGYSFTLYDIHGKPKRVATYQGYYDVNQSDNESTSTVVSEDIFEYTKPKERVNVLNYDGTLSQIPLGRNEQITMASQCVDDLTSDFTLNIDLSLGLAGLIPIPFGTTSPNIGTDYRQLSTHVINKVIRYSPILKKRITVQDGVRHITEHKVFSLSTGKPIVTTSYDGYDGLKLSGSTTNHEGAYTSYTVPGDYVYTALGGKFRNQNLKYDFSTPVFLVSGNTYTLTMPTTLYAKNVATTGDLIRISKVNGVVHNCDAYITAIQKNASNYTITIEKVNCNDILTASGSPVTVEAEVIQSGFTNQLTAPVASITTYGTTTSLSPLEIVSGEKRLKSFTNTVDVSVVTYKDQWKNDLLNSEYGITSSSNAVLAGWSGKWRPFETYSLKKELNTTIPVNQQKIYNTGVFTSDAFNFNTMSLNTTWIKTNCVTMYSPNGSPLEEKNVLNIASAAKFGYKENVPVIVAKNSTYNNAYFCSFEDFNSSNTVVTSAAHSGSKSAMVGAGSAYTLSYANVSHLNNLGAYNFTKTNQLTEKGMMVRAWVKLSNVDADLSIASVLKLRIEPLNYLVSTKQIARVGEWTLVEAIIQPNEFYTIGTNFQLSFVSSAVNVMYIDDVRVQPFDAEMACYVYNPNNLRLLATFDDQHFALLYQYNAEGKLVRKLIETEKGVKTVTEAQYNTPVKTY